MAGDDLEDVLDADAAGFARADEVAQGLFGQRHGDEFAGQLVGGDEAVDGAVEVAAMADHGTGDIVDDGRGKMHAIAGRRLFGPALHDGAAEIEVEAGNRHH
ncbi:hypothetical protein D3C87_1977340 [compost metagenome]